MSNAALHHKITYIEFTTTDIELTKKFYSTVFGWSFKDWGPDYIDSNADSAGIAIGFAKGAPQQEQPKFAPFAVLYSKDLKATGRRKYRRAHLRISRRAALPLL